MFDFLRRYFAPRKNSRQAREQARPGVQLLASMLVCFPEIASVSYDPAGGGLTLDFTVRAAIPDAEMDAFSALLIESIDTYHAIEDGVLCESQTAYERHDQLTMLHLLRPMVELTERELSLIVHLVAEKFGEHLLVDPHNMDVLDAEFSSLQHETLERMLVAVRDIPLRDRLVGIREHDQVVVYNRT